MTGRGALFPLSQCTLGGLLTRTVSFLTVNYEFFNGFWYPPLFCDRSRDPVFNSLAAPGAKYELFNANYEFFNGPYYPLLIGGRSYDPGYHPDEVHAAGSWSGL